MIDAIASQYLFPILVLSVTFALGLSLTIDSFRAIANRPKALLVGLSGQFLLLPALAVLMGLTLPMSPVIALGLTLVCLCPGGAISNAIVFAINGRAALSVSLTVCASLIMMASLPLVMPPIVALVSGDDVAGVSTLGLLRSILIAIATPLALGMTVRRFAPVWADRAIKVLRPAALALLLIAIVVSFYSAREYLSQQLPAIVAAAGLLSFLGVFGGYALGAPFRLDIEDRLTNAVEVGVQNTPFVVFLATSVLGRPDLTVIAVIYGTINFLVIFLLVALLQKRRAAAAATDMSMNTNASASRP